MRARTWPGGWSAGSGSASGQRGGTQQSDHLVVGVRVVRRDTMMIIPRGEHGDQRVHGDQGRRHVIRTGRCYRRAGRSQKGVRAGTWPGGWYIGSAAGREGVHNDRVSRLMRAARCDRVATSSGPLVSRRVGGRLAPPSAVIMHASRHAGGAAWPATSSTCYVGTLPRQHVDQVRVEVRWRASCSATSACHVSKHVT